jgi:hypothetical protein
VNGIVGKKHCRVPNDSLVCCGLQRVCDVSSYEFNEVVLKDFVVIKVNIK